MFLLILVVQCSFTFCVTHQFSLTLPSNQTESSTTARIKKKVHTNALMYGCSVHILLPVVFTVSVAALEVHVVGEG